MPKIVGLKQPVLQVNNNNVYYIFLCTRHIWIRVTVSFYVKIYFMRIDKVTIHLNMFTIINIRHLEARAKHFE